MTANGVVIFGFVWYRLSFDKYTYGLHIVQQIGGFVYYGFCVMDLSKLPDSTPRLHPIDEKEFYDQIKSGRRNFDRKIFDFPVDLHKEINDTFGPLTFQHSIFYERVRLAGITAESLNFSEAKFAEGLSLIQCVIRGICKFNNALFVSDLWVDNCVFKDRFYCRSAKFLTEMTFSDTSFEKSVDLVGLRLGGRLEIDRSTFLNDLDISGTWDYGSCEDEKELERQLEVIKTVLDIPHFIVDAIDAEKGSILIEDTVVKEWLRMRNVRTYDLEISDTTASNWAISRLRFKKSNRETCRIIKHELLKLNNRIDALSYHQREMEAHRREVKKWSGDWITLSLNHFTSRHGTNWQRSAFVTVVVFALPASLIYHFALGAEWCYDGLMCWVQPFINWWLFIFPVRDFDYAHEVTSAWVIVALFVDLVGRILIGYGIYQTITAFRKHRGVK